MARGLKRLHKSKPLEYQTKSDYVLEGTIYRGLKGLQLTFRGLYITVVIDCGVWHLEDNDAKVQYWPKYFCLR